MANFTDAVFAIAMTLIVVDIGVPAIRETDDAGALWDGLKDTFPEFLSFAIGVLAVGFYWTSHHASFDFLDRVDKGYVLLTVPYLALVAFLPYPIRLVGSFDDNPLAWICLSVNLGVVSLFEGLLYRHSVRANLLEEAPTPAQYRYNLRAALLPVAFFLLSIPFAFVVPKLTFVVWALSGVAAGGR